MSMLSAGLFVAALLLSIRTIDAAPIAIIKPGFSLTYQDGWTDEGVPSDSVYALMNTTLTHSVVIGNGLAMSSGLDASTYINAYTASYANNSARTDSSTKTLGANVFMTASFVDTTGASDTPAHVHYYVTTKNGLLFASWLISISTEDSAAVAQEEAALATLKFTATAGIRLRSVSMVSGLPRAGFDIQGRSWKPNENRMPRIAIFRK